MTEEAGVRAAVLDYVEGWFDGNAERMERALHPELVKRCRGLEGDDPDVMETLTARDMIDAAAEGIGRCWYRPNASARVPVRRVRAPDELRLQAPMLGRPPPCWMLQECGRGARATPTARTVRFHRVRRASGRRVSATLPASPWHSDT